MPRLSDATTEATIVAWLVPDGSSVRIGDEVVEIEFDKATTAWPADADGVLSIAVPAGRTVCPGTAIARIGAVDGGAAIPAGEGPSAVDSPSDDPVGGGAAGTPVEARTSVSSAGATSSDVPVEAGPAGPLAGVVPAVSPAEEASADTAVAAASASTTAPVVDPTAPGPAAPLDAEAPTLRTPSRIERLVSDRMVQSRTEIPEFTVSVEIDMGAALAMRGDLKAVGAPGGGGRTPSVNDLFVKACALALIDHPRIRSAWTDDGVLQHERIDVGVAVATDDGGLVVPVVRGADRSGLAALAAQTRELTGRARKGRITPAEMSGATFSISNLGAMGVSHFTAIIGPRQGAILAVGATIDRFVPVGGEPVLRPICTVTLSSDHRVIYGAHAAAFLERLRTILEHPGALAF